MVINSPFMGSMILMSIFLEDLHNRQFVGFIIGAIIIVLVGMLDDIYELSAKMKLLAQIVVAVY